MIGKRLVMGIGAAASAIAISACGSGAHARTTDNLGPGYVQLGALHYQVQISRELNRWDTQEDADYLKGFTRSELTLPRADEFFGVSLQVYNWSKHAATPAKDFFITDSLGQRFTPMANPAPNPYSYVPTSLPSGGQLPTINSNAFASWTQGEFLVFKIPYNALVNRPFTLHLAAPADPKRQALIELDV
jgi:hypothetical protein